VQEFNDLFARVYELNRENSNLTANGVKSLKDYQNMLLTDTDFDHKKEQPLLEALSGLVDFLIIPEFFKAAIGYDPITDEDLTDQERQNLVIDGCIQTALLGAGIGTDLVASAAEKAAAKAAAIEVGAVVGDEILIGGEGAAAEDLCIEGGTGSGLLDELASSGVKYNPKDLVSVTKTADGQLVWLENGTETAGLNHIIKDHGADFANIGIAQSEIPNYITEALSDGRVVGYQGRGIGRPIYEFAYNGVTQRVAITTGSNGFIVGANPVSLK
jgi:filamentous hemagglutinin